VDESVSTNESPSGKIYLFAGTFRLFGFPSRLVRVAKSLLVAEKTSVKTARMNDEEEEEGHNYLTHNFKYKLEMSRTFPTRNILER
jgi:hypothetical protein